MCLRGFALEWEGTGGRTAGALDGKRETIDGNVASRLGNS